MALVNVDSRRIVDSTRRRRTYGGRGGGGGFKRRVGVSTSIPTASKVIEMALETVLYKLTHVPVKNMAEYV